VAGLLANNPVWWTFSKLQIGKSCQVVVRDELSAISFAPSKTCNDCAVILSVLA
jgi:hypothetical protein